MSLMIKYRPQTFDDVIGQGVVAEVLRNQSKYDALRGLYILTGHFGGGKTTLARLIMKAANCENKDERGNPCGVCDECQGNALDLMEVDAGQTSGVDDIRKIIEWIGVRPIGRKKVLIIDEVHLLSRQAVSALLKTLEEPPEYLVIVLCTTEEDAIPDTIMSRSAQRFSLGAVPEELLKGHILKVAGLEGIRITEDAAAMLAKRSEGAVRNALGLLEQVNVAPEITGETVQAVLGTAHDEVTFHMLRSIIGDDLRGAIDALAEVDGYGIDLGAFMKDVERANADCIKAAYGCHVTGTEGYLREVERITPLYGLDALIEAAAVIQKLKVEMRQAATKEAFITTLSACSTEPEKEALRRAEALEKRIDALEKTAAALPVQSAAAGAVYGDGAEEDYDAPDSGGQTVDESLATVNEIDSADCQDAFVDAGEDVPFAEDPPAAAEPVAPAKEQEVKEEPKQQVSEPVPSAPAQPAFDAFSMMMKMASGARFGARPKKPASMSAAAAAHPKAAPAAATFTPAPAPVQAPAKPMPPREQKVESSPVGSAAAEAQKQMIEKSAETRRKLEEALCQDLDLYREMEGKYKFRAGGGKLKVVLSDPGLAGRMVYLITMFGLSNEIEVITESITHD